MNNLHLVVKEGVLFSVCYLLYLGGMIVFCISHQSVILSNL